LVSLLFSPGQFTADWQAHSATVGRSTPKVQYAYTEMAGGGNHSRLKNITYPNGRVLRYEYLVGSPIRGSSILAGHSIATIAQPYTSHLEDSTAPSWVDNIRANVK
jgi:hypothetical protein